MPELGSLFSPVEIGGVRIPNRIVLPPMTTRLASDDGYVTDAVLAYYGARAAGGVGLVTVEMASPEPVGRHRFRELGIYRDEYLPGLRRLVDSLHAAGAKVSIQLGHAGSRAPAKVSGLAPLAPSPVPTSVFEVERETVIPQEMTVTRIEQTTKAFVAAAHRARSAGFDAIELHGAHGYLISQFLSPLENRRTDDYGGSLKNRARFGLDILRRIKHEVPGLAVIFRIGVEDFFPGGVTLDEGVQVATWADLAGADAISVTAGHYRSLPSAERMIPPMRYEEGAFLGFAARVRELVAVPVIGVGRLGDPAKAAAAVHDGKVDLVALGRPLLADPRWPEKAKANLPVRRCLSCNHCVNNMRLGAPISCVVNPMTGRELEFAERKPPSGERICVLGAGPAGLSYAALVAEGNDVTVLERAEHAGGAFRYASKAPRFNDVGADEGAFDAYISELERTCRVQGVRIHYGANAAEATDLLQAADRIVVATGARYRFGLGPLARRLLTSGALRSTLGDRIFGVDRIRDLLYYRLRKGTGPKLARRLGVDPAKVTVIGDATKAGKAREAIDDAFTAAWRPTPTSASQPTSCSPGETFHNEVA